MKAYCTNTDCPFKDCDRHISHTKVGKIYDFADFTGTCRRYITWLVKEKMK